jgi:DNA-binding response OmpR family regulator
MADKYRILIVEDDPGTLKLLAHIVERAGYNPVLARSGQQGLQLLQEDGADLLLLDLMMKEMDGWDLLETIKTDDLLSALPVIIISAKHPREDPLRTEAHANMFEDYFVKPFDVNELVAKIAQILGQN